MPRMGRTGLAAALSGLTAVLLGLASLAQAAPRAQVMRTEGGARLVVYDSLCDEDNAVECLTAEVGCVAPGDFTASLYNLGAREAAAVFLKGEGRASLALGPARFTLQVLRVALSEHSFNWDVTAASLDRAAEIWGAIAAGGDVRLQAGTHVATMARADVGEGFAALAATCAPGR